MPAGGRGGLSRSLGLQRTQGIPGALQPQAWLRPKAVRVVFAHSIAIVAGGAARSQLRLSVGYRQTGASTFRDSCGFADLSHGTESRPPYWFAMYISWNDLNNVLEPGDYPFRDGTITVTFAEIATWKNSPESFSS
jgi:hypothetical protein